MTMNKNEAQRRADKLRQDIRDPAIKMEVEPEREGSRKYVVRSYRNGHPTGSVWHV